MTSKSSKIVALVVLSGLASVRMTAVGLAGSNPKAPEPQFSLFTPGQPGGRAVDVQAALQAPGVYAWKLFMYLNRPALSSPGNRRGVADPKRKLGDPGRTVWETWKAPAEIFLDGGTRPAPFDSPRKVSVFQYPKMAQLLASEMGIEVPMTVTEGATHNPALDTLLSKLASNGVGKDVSQAGMNRAAFQFVLKNELYNKEGQIKLFNENRPLSFPSGSMEVKADWKELHPAGPKDPVWKRFHTMSLDKKVYGLVALHITTKDLPNWFWCTFEHVDNDMPSVPDQALEDIEPSNNREFMRLASKWPIPKTLLGTKWANYRLRGIQNDFIQSTGTNIVLSNTRLEGLLQSTSSCMTCHSRATVDALGERLDLAIKANPSGDPKNKFIGPIGPPERSWFYDSSGNRIYQQLDFVWLLQNAKSKIRPKQPHP